MFEEMREALRKTPLYWSSANRQYPMQDGAELYTCPMPKHGEPKPNPKLAFEIAFREGQIVDGEPVVETLQQFIKLVERIASMAKRHFF